jgi:multisubunit Na+/H+ antiporter MnhB subunit
MRALTASLGIALAAWLGGVVALAVPVPEPRLPAIVAERIADSGVAHPITAVLLNFRSYDTLLEVAVLLAALVAMLAAPPSDPAALSSRTLRSDRVLLSFTRVLAPLSVLVAGYLLWAGSYQPGGAFQAGAVLAAGAVLLRLAGRLPVLPLGSGSLRLLLVAGLAAFIAVALSGWVSAGVMLVLPASHTGLVILAIEAALTVSIGLTLSCLFPGVLRMRPRARRAAGSSRRRSPSR